MRKLDLISILGSLRFHESCLITFRTFKLPGFQKGKTGQIALRFGADDFGGTLFDENVMLAAGFYNRTTEDEVREMISEAGFSPIQRLTNYEIVEGQKIEPALSN